MLRTFICTALLLIPSLAFAAPIAKHMRLDQTVEVKPLDDPNNPWRDKYDEWDRWLVENYKPLPDDSDFPKEGLDPGACVLEGDVDAAGWLLPQVEEQKLEMQWYRDSSVNPFTDTFAFRIYGIGTMMPAMQGNARRAFARARSPFYPSVPHWLLASSPQWSIMLPDGRVVATNSSAQAWPGLTAWAAPDSATLGWSLFSAQGERLSATLPASWWWESIMPDFRNLIQGYPRDYLNVVHKFGHIHVYDMKSRQTYANYDWDGTPLPANLKLHDGRDGCPFLGISGYDLPVIYDEQQKLQKGAAGL